MLLRRWTTARSASTRTSPVYATGHCNDMVVDATAMPTSATSASTSTAGGTRQSARSSMRVRARRHRSHVAADGPGCSRTAASSRRTAGTMIVGEIIGAALHRVRHRSRRRRSPRSARVGPARRSVASRRQLPRRGGRDLGRQRRRRTRSLRVREGGEITDRVDVGEGKRYACMLGGDDRPHAVRPGVDARARTWLRIDLDGHRRRPRRRAPVTSGSFG